MLHIIYTYKGKVYEANKNWTVLQCERVLNRLGSSYWECGINNN